MYDFKVIAYDHILNTTHTYYLKVWNYIDLLKSIEPFKTEACIVYILEFESKSTHEVIEYVITKENKQLLIDKICLEDVTEI